MDRLDFCRTLAVKAGRHAHTAFGRASVSMKGRHDVVTAMDAEVERYVRAAIADRYPDDAVVGEEEGGAYGERLWLIDPIDGTANYARGIPRYAVSLGYLENGVPAVGVVYDPSLDRLYTGARGEGAWCNGARLAVSHCADLDAASVECGWSTRRPAADYLALLARVFAAGCSPRRMGSGALGLADVAAGRFDAYCELHINAWDCAAGILLVTEAGGRCNDFFGGDGLRLGNALLATNAALGEKLAAATGIALAR
jgi:myo-inositol-1(or 4)-monophosphatase